MKCPNLSNKAIKEVFNKLKQAVGENAAYNLWDSNNGFEGQVLPFDTLTDGTQSVLFTKAKEMFGDIEAIGLLAKVNSREFAEEYGDWKQGNYSGEVESTGEPSLKSLSEDPMEAYSLSEEQVTRLKAKNTYSIDGLNAEQLEEVIGALQSSAYTLLESNPSFAQVADSFLKQLKAQKDLLNRVLPKQTRESAREKIRTGIEKIDILLETSNFNKLVGLMRDRFQESGVSFESIKAWESAAYNKSLDGVDEGVKEVWDDKKKMALPSKDTASFKLKMFLSSVHKQNYSESETGEKTLTKIKPVTVIGTPQLYTSEELLSELSKELHDTNGDIDDMIRRMRASNRTDFLIVANKLDPTVNTKDANLNQMRAAFKTVVKGQFHDNELLVHKTKNLYIEKKQKDGTIKKVKIPRFNFSIFSSNRSGISFDILNTWNNNMITALKSGIKTVPFTVNDDGDAALIVKVMTDNTAKMQEFHKRLLKAEKSKEEFSDAVHSEIRKVAEELKPMLEGVGMDFTTSELVKIITNPALYLEPGRTEDKRSNVTSSMLFTTKGSKSKLNVFGQLFLMGEGIGGVSERVSVVSLTELKLPMTTIVNKLSKIKNEFNPKPSSSIHINGEGNQVANYGMPHGLSVMMDAFKENYKDLLVSLENDPFSGDSYWLRKAADKYFMEGLALKLFDVSKQDKGIKKKTKVQLTDAELVINQLALFHNNNTPNMQFFPVVFGDKSREIKMQAEKIWIDRELVDFSITGEETPKLTLGGISGTYINEAIAGLIRGEIKRHNHIKKRVVELTEEHAEELGLVESKNLNKMFETILQEAAADREYKFDKTVTELTKDSTLYDIMKASINKIGADYVRGSREFYMFPSVKETLNAHKNSDGLINENLSNYKLAEMVLGELEQEINNTLESWTNAGIIENKRFKNVDFKALPKDLQVRIKDAAKNNQIIEDQLSYIGEEAVNYTLNSIIAQGNFVQVFAGDPALYYKGGVKGTWENFIKRMSGLIGTSQRSQYSFFLEENGTNVKKDFTEYEQWILEDIETSRYAKEYKERFGLDYKGANSTDAFEMTTLREHVTTLVAQGKIEDAKARDIYAKIDKGNDLSADELVALIPQKPLYFMSEFDSDSKTRVTTYVKTSSLPLIPQFTRGNEVFDALRKAMEAREDALMTKNAAGAVTKNVNVRAVYKSGVKAGVRNVLNPFKISDETGKLEGVDTGALKGYKGIRLSREGFGMQQEESTAHSFEILSVSQMNKLLFEGLMTKDAKGKDLFDSFVLEGDPKKYTATELKAMKEQVRTDLFKLGREKLERRLGIEDGQFKSLKKLQEVLLDEATKKGYSTNEIESLQLVDGKLAMPLAMNTSFDRLVSMLQSLIDGNIVKQKVNGASYVQASGGAFKVKKLSDLKSSEIVTTDDFTGELKYPEFNADGTLKNAVQVMIPWYFKDSQGRDVKISDVTRITEDGRTVIDNSKLPPELLRSIGARIPNQGHSSMVPIEVVGFLPPHYHDMILLPDEIVIQTGSDFDIDHLYNYLYNYSVDRNYHDEATDMQVQIDEMIEKFGKEDMSFKDGEIEEDIDSKNVEEVKKKAARELKLWYSSEDGKFYHKQTLVKIDKAVEGEEGRNKKEALQNKYIDIHWSVLTNPKVIGKVLRSLDFKDTGPLTDSIREAKESAAGGKSNLFIGQTYFNEEYQANQAGKMGVAVQSIASTFLAMIQDKNLRLIDAIGGDTGIQIGGLSLSKLGRGEYTNELGELRTNSDAISMLQSEAVDNAKNKLLSLLGYNSTVAGMYNAALMLTTEGGKSLSLEFVTKLMNQPIVTEFVNRVKNLETMFDKTDDDSAREILEEMIGETDMADLPNVSLTSDSLMRSVAGKNSKEIHDSIQRETLKILQSLLPVADKLRFINSATNSDTKGVGKNMFISMNRERMLRDHVLRESVIGGTRGLVGTYIREEFVPTTELGHNLTNGLLFANDLWTRKVEGSYITPFGTPVFNDVLDMLKKLKLRDDQIARNEDTYLNADEMADMWKGMKSYIYADSSSPLFLGSNIFDERVRLFTNSVGDSLGERVINHLKDNNNKAGRTFLEELQVEKGINSADPDIINYNLSKSTKIGERILIGSFLDLLTGNAEEQRLGEDLVRYVFLEGGNVNPKSFIKLVPTEYLIEIGLGEYFNSFEYSTMNAGKLFEQILQNNPELAPDIPKQAKVKGAPIGFKIPIEGNENKKDYYSNKYSTKGEETPFLYKLYGTVGNSYQYVKLDKGGTVSKTGSSEFDSKSPGDSMNSVFRGNTVNKEYQAKNLKLDKAKRVKTGEGFSNGAANDTFLDGYFNKAKGKEGIFNAIEKIASSDSTFKPLAELLMNAKDSIDNNMILDIGNTESRGKFDLATNTLSLNLDLFFHKEKKSHEFRKEFEETLLHEVLHAVTLDYNAKRRKGEKINHRVSLALANAERAFKEIQELYKDDFGFRKFKNAVDKRQIARLTDNKAQLAAGFGITAEDINRYQPLLKFDEFLVGALTNRTFLEELASKNDTGIKIKDKDSILRKISDVFRKLYNSILNTLGKGLDSKAVTAAVNNSFKVIEEIILATTETPVLNEVQKTVESVQEVKIQGTGVTVILHLDEEESFTKSNGNKSPERVYNKALVQVGLKDGFAEIVTYNGNKFAIVTNKETPKIIAAEKTEFGKEKYLEGTAERDAVLKLSKALNPPAETTITEAPFSLAASQEIESKVEAVKEEYSKNSIRELISEEDFKRLSNINEEIASLNDESIPLKDRVSILESVLNFLNRVLEDLKSKARNITKAESITGKVYTALRTIEKSKTLKSLPIPHARKMIKLVSAARIAIDTIVYYSVDISEDVDTDNIGTATDFVKSLNKEERAKFRELLAEGRFSIKCD